MKARSWPLGIIAVLCLVFAGCGNAGRSQTREIAEGQRLYLSYGCGACHGRDGQGNGPAAASLKIRPRDFRRAEAFKKERSVSSIERTIAEGFGGPGGVMPASPFIEARERKVIALYVLSLATESPSARSH